MEITLSNVDSAYWVRWTPEMAAVYLREEHLVLRTFSETLKRIYPGDDLQDRLTAEFSYSPEGEFLGPDSASRKVRNWLGDRHSPTDREDIFRIGFALGLTEGQVNRLLGQCTSCGIHYRDGRDVIYSWFLRFGKTYREARAFFVSLPPVSDAAPLPPGGGSNITHQLQELFMLVSDKESLRKLYISKLDLFGGLHLRAYAYFDKYLRQLTSPVSSMGREPDYSLEEVADLYLGMNMPRRRTRKGWNAVQKLIKHNWPNATSIKNIRARKEDVPRKLLLLLYVVTENVVDSGYCEYDESYISASERLEEHWWTLNAILTDCGMPVLDPRDPTDWLVLYALASDSEPMSERMAEVIEHLYD